MTVQRSKFKPRITKNYNKIVQKIRISRGKILKCLIVLLVVGLLIFLLYYFFIDQLSVAYSLRPLEYFPLVDRYKWSCKHGAVVVNPEGSGESHLRECCTSSLDRNLKKHLLQGNREASSSSGFVAADRSGKVFAYSAHYSVHTGTVVLVAILEVQQPRDLFRCLLWLEREVACAWQVPAAVEVPRSLNRQHKYISALISCPLMGTKPLAVTLLSRAQDSVPVTLPVIYPNIGDHFYTMTRCVPPLYENFKDVMELIQMVQISRFFGTSRFVFYVSNVKPEVQKLLEYYVSQKMAEVHLWQIPVTRWRSAQYWSWMAFRHDCLFRSTGVSNFVVFAGTGEVLVPQDGVISGVLDAFRKASTKCGVFRIKSAIFPTITQGKQLDFSGKEEALELNLTFFLSGWQSTVERSDHIMLAYVPEALRDFNQLETGNMQIGFETCDISSKDVLVHNYQKRNVANFAVTKNAILARYATPILADLLEPLDALGLIRFTGRGIRSRSKSLRSGKQHHSMEGERHFYK